MEISKKFTFEAAHYLPNVPMEHKCRRLHGHSFAVEITVAGSLNPELGWVMDYADLKTAFRPIWEQLDHRYLNEIEGLTNPTSENLAIWIWEKLAPKLPQLCQIEIMETCTSRCRYRGPNS